MMIKKGGNAGYCSRPFIVFYNGMRVFLLECKFNRIRKFLSYRRVCLKKLVNLLFMNRRKYNGKI